MKSIGNRLGKRDKAKWGDIWDWIKSKMIDSFLLCRSVQNNLQSTITVDAKDNTQAQLR